MVNVTTFQAEPSGQIAAAFCCMSLCSLPEG